MRYRIVSRLIGLLLLTAAGLKFYGQAVAAVPQTGIFSTPSFQFAIIVWEIALGCWLISGASRVGAWLLACATFGAFAMISGYLGWIGQATCGCFGKIDASPWAAFAIDLAVLALLAIGRPHRSELRGSHSWALRVSGVVAGTLAIFLLFVVLVPTRYGSLEAALARIQGETIIAPAYVDFGQIEAGQTAERAIEVTNATNQPIRLIGGTSDCSCITTKDLPMALAPGERHSLTIALRAPQSTGMFTRSAQLTFDDGKMSRQALRIGGRVR